MRIARRIRPGIEWRHYIRAGYLYFLLAACSSNNATPQDDGGGDEPPPGDGAVTLAGAAFKGTAVGSTVRVFRVTDTGTKITPPIAQTTTDASGQYTVSFDGAGPVRVEATGGTYTDEATGQPKTIPDAMPLAAVVDSVDGTAQVSLTAVTTLQAIVFDALSNRVDFDAASSIANARSMIDDHFQLTDGTAQPQLTGSVDEVTIMAISLAMSQLGLNLSVDPMEVIYALGRDVAHDFSFDGKDRGVDVSVGAGALPANTGTSGILDAFRATQTLTGNPLIAAENVLSQLTADVCPPPVVFGLTGFFSISDSEVSVIVGNANPDFSTKITIGGVVLNVDTIRNVGLDSSAPIFSFVGELEANLFAGKHDVVIEQTKPNGKKFQQKLPGIVCVVSDFLSATTFGTLSFAGGSQLRIKATDAGAGLVTQDGVTLPPDAATSRSQTVTTNPAGGSSVIEFRIGGQTFTIDASFVAEQEDAAQRDARRAALAGSWCDFGPTGPPLLIVINADGTASLILLEPNEDGDFVPTSDTPLPAVVNVLANDHVEISTPLGVRQFTLVENDEVMIGCSVVVKKPAGFAIGLLAGTWNTIGYGTFNNSPIVVGGTLEADANGKVNCSIQALSGNTSFPGWKGEIDFTASDDGALSGQEPSVLGALIKLQMNRLNTLMIGKSISLDEACPYDLNWVAVRPCPLDAGDLEGGWSGGATLFMGGGATIGAESYAFAKAGGNNFASNYSFDEEMTETPSFISFPYQTRTIAQRSDVMLSPNGILRWANGTQAGLMSKDGDLMFEFEINASTRLSFLSQIAAPPILVSIRARASGFQTSKTFQGEMNEIEFGIETGFGPGSFDIAATTRVSEGRRLENGLRDDGLGTLQDPTNGRKKVVVRTGSDGVPTASGADDSRPVAEAYAVVSNHLFFLAQSLEGGAIVGPPITAQGKITSDGEIAVLRGPAEGHGGFLRILAKKTITAPTITGAYTIACLALDYDELGPTTHTVRGTITFAGDGTFAASLTRAVENINGLGIATPVNESGTFTVTDDGRFTLTTAEGTTLKGMVARNGESIFLVDANEASTRSELCVCVKQGATDRARGSYLSLGMRFDLFPFNRVQFTGESDEVLRRADNDLDLRQRRFVAPANFAQGTLEFFNQSATEVLAPNGSWTFQFDFQKDEGALAPSGAIGVLVPEPLRGSRLRILIGN